MASQRAARTAGNPTRRRMTDPHRGVLSTGTPEHTRTLQRIAGRNNEPAPPPRDAAAHRDDGRSPHGVVFTSMKPRTALSVLLVLLAVAPAAAGPYINPGLMTIPDAYTIEHTAIRLNYSGSFFLGMQPTDPDITDYYDVSLSGGLEFWGLGLELTFAAYDFDTSAYVGSAELRFINETPRFPAVAVGVRNIGADVEVSSFGTPGEPGGASQYMPPGYEREWYEQFSGYVIFSKDFYPALEIPLTGHLGLGTGMFQGMYTSTYTGSETWQGVFGALEYRPFYFLSMALEVTGRDLNFGVLYELPWWGMEIGISIDKLEMLFYSDEEVLLLSGGVIDEYDQVGLGVHFGVEFGPFVTDTEVKKLELIDSRIQEGEDRLREIQIRRREIQDRLAELRQRIADENENGGDGEE